MKKKSSKGLVVCIKHSEVLVSSAKVPKSVQDEIEGECEGERERERVQEREWVRACGRPYPIIY